MTESEGAECTGKKAAEVKMLISVISKGEAVQGEGKEAEQRHTDKAVRGKSVFM